MIKKEFVVGSQSRVRIEMQPDGGVTIEVTPLVIDSGDLSLDGGE